MNSNLFFPAAQTRREFLWKLGGGFAGLALAQMFARDAVASGISHHPAKVKRIIQLFMTGGASPMDTFDYKPALEKLHGQMLGPKEKPEGFVAPAGAIMKSHSSLHSMVNLDAGSAVSFQSRPN